MQKSKIWNEIGIDMQEFIYHSIFIKKILIKNDSFVFSRLICVINMWEEMKSLEEFKIFFNSTFSSILPQIQDAKQYAKELNKQVFFKYLGISIAFVAICSIIMATVSDPGWKDIIYAIIALGLMIILVLMFTRMSDNKKQQLEQFDVKIYQPVLKFINPGLEYSDSDTLGVGAAVDADIFDDYVNELIVNQSFYGTINGTNVDFAEVKAQREVVLVDDDNNEKTEHRLVFEGLFFVFHLDRSSARLAYSFFNERRNELWQRIGDKTMFSARQSKFYFAVPFDNTFIESYKIKNAEPTFTKFFLIVSTAVGMLEELQASVANMEEEE